MDTLTYHLNRLAGLLGSYTPPLARAAPGTVGYLGAPGALTVLNVGDPPPAGTFWDGSAFRIFTDDFVLDHYRINATVFITASNVTVSNCVVHCNADDFYGITVNGAGRGVLTVTDTTVVGNSTGTSPQVNGISSDSDILVRRCDVSNTGDGIHFIANPGCLISQCYIHDLSFVNEAQHCDGIQGFNSASPGGNFTVEHCYVGPIFSTIGTPGNSGLTFGPPSDNAEPLCTPTVNNNYFDNGGYHLRIGFRQQNGTITHNDFGDINPTEFGYISVEQAASITTWADNRNENNGIITSPGITDSTVADSSVPPRSAVAAANIWAGTSGLSLVDAVNAKAGFPVPKFNLTGALNSIAGTSHLTAVDAISRIP